MKTTKKNGKVITEYENGTKVEMLEGIESVIEVKNKKKDTSKMNLEQKVDYLIGLLESVVIN